MKYITVGLLKKACKKHKFLLLRYKSGNIMAINTGVAKIALKKRKYNNKNETNFIGYFPCNFSTYITYKKPFMKS